MSPARGLIPQPDERAHHFPGIGWIQLLQWDPRRRGVNGRIVCDPSPTDPLGQCPSNDAVDTSDGGGGVQPTRSTDLEQLAVKTVEVGWGQFATWIAPSTGMIGSSMYIRVVSTVFGEKLGVAWASHSRHRAATVPLLSIPTGR